jgi:hypothetical protein
MVMTKTIGFILIGLGALLGLVGCGALGVSLNGGGLETGGAVMGFILMAIVLTPIIGVGVFLVFRGKQETITDQDARQQRQLLDMVTTRGQLRISDAVIELKSNRDQVQKWVYNLVGLGVFSGYVNWDDGVLYSAQASKLRELTECKRCGGKVELSGKGIIRCAYCGTEYYL